MNVTLRHTIAIGSLAAALSLGACNRQSRPSEPLPEGTPAPASSPPATIAATPMAELCVATINRYRATLGLAAYA